MLEQLKQKWKVSNADLLVILVVFAITGLSTAFISRSITGWVGFTDATPWFWKLLLRLVVLLFGYQLILLTVAFLLGQFSFFWQFEKKMLQKLGLIKKDESKIN